MRDALRTIGIACLGQIIGNESAGETLPWRVDAGSAAMHAYMSKLLVYHAKNVIRGVIFFKHEGYRNEKEFRFQQMFRRNRPAPNVNYRHRPHSLIRYREFDWRTVASHSLKRIVIGPAANRIKAERFVRDCLAAFHPEDDVKVVWSRIPYRSGFGQAAML
jgi:hypothetical protein